MIYLDSSALVKLIHPELETRALRSWLAARPGVSVSSALAALEVTRALRRSDPAALPRVPGVTLVPVAEPIIVSAAALTDPLLRSLDALHLATALRSMRRRWSSSAMTNAFPPRPPRNASMSRCLPESGLAAAFVITRTSTSGRSPRRLGDTPARTRLDRPGTPGVARWKRQARVRRMPINEVCQR